MSSAVALFTRAWIEIPKSRAKKFVPASPSSRGRGLKYTNNFDGLPICVVALFTRAWIEIITNKKLVYKRYVALFTRAWIEIASKALVSRGSSSPSSRGRGLKYKDTV